MKAEGRERATHGFTMPSDDWHLVEVMDGIDYAKDADTHEILLDKKGAKKHIIKFQINDGDDEANGAQVSMFITENDRGEQRMADILAATGQYKKFAEKFPGDISAFDDAVMSAIKIKLPGQFMKVKTKVAKGKDKSGETREYCNIIETATVGFDPAKEDKGGKKDDKKADKKADTKAAPKVDEW
jgi:hypothetical protein